MRKEGLTRRNFIQLTSLAVVTSLLSGDRPRESPYIDRRAVTPQEVSRDVSEYVEKIRKIAEQKDIRPSLLENGYSKTEVTLKDDQSRISAFFLIDTSLNTVTQIGFTEQVRNRRTEYVFNSFFDHWNIDIPNENTISTILGFNNHIYAPVKQTADRVIAQLS